MTFLNSNNIDNRAPILLASFHFLISLVLVQYHEFWRDEVQMWLISESSNSIAELLINKDPDHPVLWYFTLYFIENATGNPFWMQVFNILNISFSVYLICRFAPMNWTQKTLLSFGYYLLFEYNLLARNYAPTISMMFLVLVLLHDWKRNLLWIAVSLLIMANYHTVGTILAGGIGLYIFVELIKSRWDISKAKLGWSLAIYILGLLASVFEALRRTIGWGYFEPYTTNGIQPFGNLVWAYNSVVTFFYGFFTLPNLNDPYIWNTSFLMGFSWKIRFTIGVFSTIILVVLILWKVRKNVGALLMFMSVGGALLFLFSFVKYGQLRNHGYFFIAFVFVLWTLNRTNKDKLLNNVFTFFLGLQLISGLILVKNDLMRPFSNAKATAKFLVKNDLIKHKIVGLRDFAMSPVTHYANTSIYFPESRTTGTFMEWGKRKYFESLNEVFTNVQKEVGANEKPIILIVNRGDFDQLKNLKYTPEQKEYFDNNVELLYQNKDALVRNENYWVYKFNP